MDDLKEVIGYFLNEINNLKKEISLIQKELGFIKKSSLLSSFFPTTDSSFQTNKLPFKPLNPQILNISIRNQGVPTDRPTHQHTNKSDLFKGNFNAFSKAEILLDDLSFLKGEIKNLFKKLTSQEFLVLLTILNLREKNSPCNYRILSERLNLSESSIRDYVGKIIKKGIPIEKTKLNNKNILLSLSPSFLNLIPLNTLSLFKNLD